MLYLGGGSGVLHLGGQGACLHHFLLCGFAGLHCVRGGWLAGFLGELVSGVDGGALGGVVALHLLRVLGGGVAGGGRAVVRAVARAHSMLGSVG